MQNKDSAYLIVFRSGLGWGVRGGGAVCRAVCGVGMKAVKNSVARLNAEIFHVV